MFQRSQSLNHPEAFYKIVWQDIIIFVIIILFSYALIPQIILGFKRNKALISLQTSSITFISRYILTFVYFTLNLYFSTIIGFITGTSGLILFIQGIVYRKT